MKFKLPDYRKPLVLLEDETILWDSGIQKKSSSQRLNNFASFLIFLLYLIFFYFTFKPDFKFYSSPIIGNAPGSFLDRFELFNIGIALWALIYTIFLIKFSRWGQSKYRVLITNLRFMEYRHLRRWQPHWLYFKLEDLISYSLEKRPWESYPELRFSKDEIKVRGLTMENQQRFIAELEKNLKLKSLNFAPSKHLPRLMERRY